MVAAQPWLAEPPEESIPVGKIFENKTRKNTSNLKEEFMDFQRPDSLNYEFDPSDRNKVLELLAQLIAQLPRIPKKVLATYYHENLRPT